MNIYDLKDYTVIAGPETGVPVTEIKKKNFGQKLVSAAKAVSKFSGAEAIQEKIGADIARDLATKSEKQYITEPSKKEIVGSVIQTGANFLPGVGKGASVLGKVGAGAATGLAFDVGSDLQAGKSIGEAITPGVGTAIGAVIPGAGATLKPVNKIVSRLFKGLGSGVSGVSVDTIDKIIANPETAQKASQILAKSGNAKVLEENSRAIVNGIAKIKNEARSSFGKGLEQLSKEDIAPKTFRESTQGFLDKYGVTSEGNQRILANIEFDDPKNVQKASDLINKLSTSELDGKSLRKLADDIENAKYKTATSDERLSFNAFINDLSSTLKDAISSSTSKLNEMDQKFSQDMQLAETAEDIFGNVNFKNLPEVVKASQKLEGLFAQKGLAPEVVDDFLTRIDMSPEDFKTTEAVRQISNKQTGANTKGLSVGEMAQQVTSAVITPKMVKNIAIKTGLAEKKVLPFLRQLKVGARNVVIQALLSTNQSDSK